MRRLGAAGAGALAFCLIAFLPFAFSAPSARAAQPDDLEERIPELEATTVRGGNRQLPLRLYGQVNRAVLFWNDGFDSGVFGVDNDTSSSRIGFAGQAAIAPNWTAGYRFEFDAAFPSSHEVFNDPGNSNGVPEAFGSLRVRQSCWDVVSKDLGRFAAHFYDPTILGSACDGPDCAFDPAKHPVTRLPAASWQGFVVGARIQC
jgi:hypothetical protein